MESTRCDGDELLYADCLMSFNSNSRPDENDSAFLASALDEMANLPGVLNQDVVKELVPPEDVKEPEIGMEFESDEAARIFYNEYAGHIGFPFRVGRSRRSKGAVDMLIMKRFVCSKEGIYRKKPSNGSTRKRERASMREGCKAMMEVVRESSRWVVSKLEKAHNHNLGTSSKVGYLRSRILNGTCSDTTVVPSDTVLTNRQHGFGVGGDAQGILDYLSKRQSQEPTFFYAIHVDNDSCVSNAFWAEQRARCAYQYFGDTVTLDTTYKKNKYMMPFVTFSGINHHLQPVIFGCALLADESELSFVWLLETWLAAMGGKAPTSFTTEQNRAIAAATSRIFPNTCHRICKWQVLSKTKQKLSHLCSAYSTLPAELEHIFIECETIETFEASWASLLDKYDLRKNSWLQMLFNIRHKWVSLYLKDTFFAEMCPKEKLETLNDYYKKHFSNRTSIRVFLAQFDADMAVRLDEEAQHDYETLYTKPTLKTASIIEKQAANLYTRSVFNKFQEEFAESLGYIIQKIGEGDTSKYCVHKDDGSPNSFFVTCEPTKVSFNCSCKLFVFSGILCRHILGVLIIVDPRVLPEGYFLKRWTRNAKDDTAVANNNASTMEISPASVASRYSSLCCDAIKCADRGANSLEIYKTAKETLQKAYEEILSLDRDATRGPHRDGININEEITIENAINDEPLHDSSRKVGSSFGHLLGSSWSPM